MASWEAKGEVGLGAASTAPQGQWVAVDSAADLVAVDSAADSVAAETAEDSAVVDSG